MYCGRGERLSVLPAVRDARFMTVESSADLTELLGAWQDGDGAAFERVAEIVYDDLRQIASRQLNGERPDHTLQTTGLVHEAYLRLVDQRRAHWHSRLHFFAVAARVMRRILVDHARGRQSLKRGGHLQRISLSSELEIGVERPAPLLDVDEALARLEDVDPRLSQVVELRFFAGLTSREIADLLGISAATVGRRWRAARAWLYRHLREVP